MNTLYRVEFLGRLRRRLQLEGARLLHFANGHLALGLALFLLLLLHRGLHFGRTGPTISTKPSRNAGSNGYDGIFQIRARRSHVVLSGFICCVLQPVFTTLRGQNGIKTEPNWGKVRKDFNPFQYTSFDE